MRVSRLLSLSIAALGGAVAAGAQGTHGSSGHGDMPARTPSGPGATALLTGPMGARSASGMATLDGATIDIAWWGDQPGTERGWYVHRGTCGRDGGVVGSPAALRPILVDARGRGASRATLPTPPSENDSYFVAVHAAPAAGSDVIACGALATDAAIAARGAGGRESGGMQNMPGMRSAPQPASPMPMDHSRLAPAAGTTRTDGAGAPADASAVLMATFERLLGDPTVRQRVTADTALRRTMTDLVALMPEEHRSMALAMMPDAAGGTKAADPATGALAPRGPTTGRPATAAPRVTPRRTGMPGMPGMTHERMTMPGMAMPARSQPAKRTGPAAKPAPKTPAPKTPAPKKPVPRPAKDSMPRMDHGSMPATKRGPRG